MGPSTKVQSDRTGDGGDYVFQHALTHDVSYESLLLAHRRDLHRRVAAAIEALWPDQIEQRAAILGLHYAKGEMPEKAVTFLTQAGDRAAANYANEEAIGFYRQALEQMDLARGEEEVVGPAMPAAGLHERVGDLLELIGRHEEARDEYGRASTAPLREDGARARARFCRKIAKTHESQRDWEVALSYYEKAEAALGEAKNFSDPDWEELIETRLERIWAYYFFGRSEELSREVRALRSHVETHGNARQRGEFLHRSVLMRFRQERYAVSDETVALALQALRDRQQTGHLLRLGHAHFLVGLAHVCRRELAEAEEQLQAALGIAERTGDIILLARSLAYFVVVERRRQDLAAAGRRVKRLLPVATQGAMSEYLAVAKATQAWIEWRRGHDALACGEARAALELWASDIAFPFKWLALWPLVAIAASRKEVSEIVRQSRLLFEETQQPLPPLLAACVGEIITASESGQEDKALQMAERAVQLARQLTYL
jgi:tetratricopeptide (TPR) repeat protein